MDDKVAIPSSVPDLEKSFHPTCRLRWFYPRNRSIAMESSQGFGYPILQQEWVNEAGTKSEWKELPAVTEIIMEAQINA